MFKIAGASKFKRTLATIACATVVAAGATTMANGAQLANGVSYTVKGDVVTISGNGAIPDFAPKSAPWHGNAPYAIKKVIIEEGVTGIGAHAFDDLMCLETVVVPSTITSIGDGAFDACWTLQSFGMAGTKKGTAVIGAKVASIGKDAFHGCTGLQQVYLQADDISQYRFDDAADVKANVFDFCNPDATTFHVSAAFGDTITKDECEALALWQQAAHGTKPVVADIPASGKAPKQDETAQKKQQAKQDDAAQQQDKDGWREVARNRHTPGSKDEGQENSQQVNNDQQESGVAPAEHNDHGPDMQDQRVNNDQQESGVAPAEHDDHRPTAQGGGNRQPTVEERMDPNYRPKDGMVTGQNGQIISKGAGNQPIDLSNLKRHGE